MYLLGSLTITCLAIMQKKYLKEIRELNSGTELKEIKRLQKLNRVWSQLPYRVRLRIEHTCFVGSLIYNNWSKIKTMDIMGIRKAYYRKLSNWSKEILLLKTVWYRSTEIRVFKDSEQSPEMSAFLNRVSHINHFQN